MQARQLLPQLLAKLRVQAGERLVEEVEARAPHERAAQGDALALAAGKLARAFAEMRGKAQRLRGLAHALLGLRGRSAPGHEPERHVLAHGHVRIEREPLEHHRDVPLLGLEARDVAPVHVDVSAGRRLQPGDEAEERGFSASRRPEHRQELAVLKLEIDSVERARSVRIGEGEVFQREGSHGGVNLTRAAAGSHRRRPRAEASGPQNLSGYCFTMPALSMSAMLRISAWTLS